MRLVMHHGSRIHVSWLNPRQNLKSMQKQVILASDFTLVKVCAMDQSYLFVCIILDQAPLDREKRV